MIDQMLDVAKKSPFVSPFTVAKCESSNGQQQLVPDRTIALAAAVDRKYPRLVPT